MISGLRSCVFVLAHHVPRWFLSRLLLVACGMRRKPLDDQGYCPVEEREDGGGCDALTATRVTENIDPVIAVDLRIMSVPGVRSGHSGGKLGYLPLIDHPCRSRLKRSPTCGPYPFGRKRELVKYRRFIPRGRARLSPGFGRSVGMNFPG